MQGKSLFANEVALKVGNSKINSAQNLSIGNGLNKPLMFSACFAFIFCVSIWQLMDHTWPFFDAADHIRVSDNYCKLLQSPHIWKLSWIKQFLTVNYAYPATVHIYNGFLKLLFGNEIWVDRFSLILFSSLLNFSVYLIAWKTYKNNLTAALTVLVVNCYPLVADLSHVVLLDFPNFALFCCAILSLLWWQEKPTWFRTITTGMIITSFATAKQISAFYLIGPCFIIFLSLLIERNYRQILKLLILISMVLAGLAIWLIPNWAAINLYMGRNGQIIQETNILIVFANHLLGYVRKFPEIFSTPLLCLLILSCFFIKRQHLSKLMFSMSAAVGGIFCIFLLQFQLPDQRYIVPILLIASLLSGNALAICLQLKHNRFSSFAKAITILLLAISIMQFATFNYINYKPFKSDDIASYAISNLKQLSNRDQMELSYTAYPESSKDSWCQEWLVDKMYSLSKTSEDTIVVMPNTKIFNVHTINLIAKHKNIKNLTATTFRMWTPLGDQILSSELPNNNCNWFVLKTGDQGSLLRNQLSKNNYNILTQYITNHTQLIAEKNLPDSSVLSIYKRIDK